MSISRDKNIIKNFYRSQSAPGILISAYIPFHFSFTVPLSLTTFKEMLQFLTLKIKFMNIVFFKNFSYFISNESLNIPEYICLLIGRVFMLHRMEPAVQNITFTSVWAVCVSLWIWPPNWIVSNPNQIQDFLFSFIFSFSPVFAFQQNYFKFICNLLAFVEYIFN